MTDSIYVIGTLGLPIVKIGVSNDPQLRLRQIRTMSPVPVMLRWTGPGDVRLEQLLHKRFAAYRSHGEWFNLPKDAVQSVHTWAEILRPVIGTSWTEHANWFSDVGSHILDEDLSLWLDSRVSKVFPRTSFTWDELAEATGSPPSFIRRVGPTLIANGRIVQQRDGRADQPRYTRGPRKESVWDGWI